MRLWIHNGLCMTVKTGLGFLCSGPHAVIGIVHILTIDCRSLTYNCGAPAIVVNCPAEIFMLIQCINQPVILHLHNLTPYWIQKFWILNVFNSVLRCFQKIQRWKGPKSIRTWRPSLLWAFYRAVRGPLVPILDPLERLNSLLKS